MSFRSDDDKALLKEFAEWLAERWLQNYSERELNAAVDEFYKSKEIG